MGETWPSVLPLLLLGIFVALAFGGLLYAVFALQSALRRAQREKENVVSVAKEIALAQQRSERELATAQQEFQKFCKKPIIMTVTNAQMDQMARYVASLVVLAMPAPETVNPKKVN